MAALTRRALLASSSTALLAASGCLAIGSSPTPAHWVTVYHVDADVTRDVTVTVENGGEVLFEREYRLSDGNEADEDAPFPASTDPTRVVVTVDGARFEREWPGFENQQLPCDDPNTAGIEIWIENGRDESPEIRLLADCQRVTME